MQDLFMKVERSYMYCETCEQRLEGLAYIDHIKKGHIVKLVTRDGKMRRVIGWTL